jgi:hypothetical protein
LTVSGLKAGDEVFFTTDGTHNHVLVEAVAGASFDIGGYSIQSSESTPFAINNIKFDDDAPTITAPFDADPGTAGIQTPEKLGNAVGQTASGTFGYDIGADAHLAAFYTAGAPTLSIPTVALQECRSA